MGSFWVFGAVTYKGAYFKVLPQQWPGGTEENYEKIRIVGLQKKCRNANHNTTTFGIYHTNAYRRLLCRPISSDIPVGRTVFECWRSWILSTVECRKASDEPDSFHMQKFYYRNPSSRRSIFCGVMVSWTLQAGAIIWFYLLLRLFLLLVLCLSSSFPSPSPSSSVFFLLLRPLLFFLLRAVLFRIRIIPGTNIESETGYHDREFCWTSPALPREF